MFSQKEKTTVPIPSAPTDGEQSLSNASIITTNNDKINHSEEFSEENFLELQQRLDRFDPGLRKRGIFFVRGFFEFVAVKILVQIVRRVYDQQIHALRGQKRQHGKAVAKNGLIQNFGKRGWFMINGRIKTCRI